MINSRVGTQKVFAGVLSWVSRETFMDWPRTCKVQLSVWLVQTHCRLRGSRREGSGSPGSPWNPVLCHLAPQSTHRAAFREVVGGTAQEIRPAPLPLHDGTGASGGLAEGAAGQLYPVILTLGHVHSAQQGLNHCPAAGGIPEAWVGGRDRMGTV
jgi:hypothetical protein